MAMLTKIPFLYTSVIKLFRLVSNFLSLQLEFSQELYIKNISIIETYNSGVVANISVWNSQHMVSSATHGIYVWCLTMFLLQCHLEKRTLRIFGGKDSRFYTQLISTLQFKPIGAFVFPLYTYENTMHFTLHCTDNCLQI